MTDWAVQSVIFMSKTTRKQPEIERKLPKYYPDALQATFVKTPIC